MLVKESGFAPDDFEKTGKIVSLDNLLNGSADEINEPLGLDLPNDCDVDPLLPWLDRLALIRVPFPAFADGRAFSLAKRLRSLGFTGRLRAAGHILVDQARAARRVGFTEFEISDDLAERQPEDHWLSILDDYSYQSRVHKIIEQESMPL